MKKKIFIFILVFAVAILCVYGYSVYRGGIITSNGSNIQNDSPGRVAEIDCENNMAIISIELNLTSGEYVRDKNGTFISSGNPLTDSSFKKEADNGVVKVEVSDKDYKVIATYDVKSGESSSKKIFLNRGMTYHVQLTNDGDFKGYFAYKQTAYKFF